MSPDLAEARANPYLVGRVLRAPDAERAPVCRERAVVRAAGQLHMRGGHPGPHQALLCDHGRRAAAVRADTLRPVHLQSGNTSAHRRVRHCPEESPHGPHRSPPRPVPATRAGQSLRPGAACERPHASPPLPSGSPPTAGKREHPAHPEGHALLQGLGPGTSCRRLRCPVSSAINSALASPGLCSASPGTPGTAVPHSRVPGSAYLR